MKIGILGGGQLGRMLLQEGANYPVETWILENDTECPSAHLCHGFVKGNIKDYDDVVAFGKDMDLITIEIEAVNVDALDYLESIGKTIIPKPVVLRTIKNKVLQKQFYASNQIPSPAFEITSSKSDLLNYKSFLPAVHKIGEGGYDGKGVQIINTPADFENGFDGPSVLEKLVDIEREIAITVAVDLNGQIALYPPVEMIFDPRLNLLDYQLCPARIPENTHWKAEAIAIQVAKAFKSPGIFAVEMLIEKNGTVWVNETAPRVHNSGHHSIEAHISSQYEMLWRIMLGYPLGSTAMLMPSALVNLIGAQGFSGTPHYSGLETVLKTENIFVHIYGKGETKPGRKMGHVTILGKDHLELNMKAKMVKETISVVTKV